MANKMGIYGCLAVVALLLHVAPAVTFPTVWKLPSIVGEVRNWAAGKNIRVGDTLELAGNVNDVLEVPKRVYETCETISSIRKKLSTPESITIRADGIHYYASTDPVLCKDGKKFEIKADNSDGTVTPSGPSPPASPSGSSSSLTVTGFFITLASYIVAFLY